MRVAYVVSGMRLTFVVSEAEAHRQAGWTVVPFASCAPESVHGRAALVAAWIARTTYRERPAVLAIAVAREARRNPRRFARAVAFTASLLPRSPSEFAKTLYELPAACQFAPAVRADEIAHLHAHFASRSLGLGLLLGMLTDLPVSCTVHAFDLFTRSPGSLTPRLSRCAFIAAISEYNIRYLREKCGDAVADLCTVVHCGIDGDRFRLPARAPKPGALVCIANLVPPKGHALAIRACGVLRDRGVPFTYTIVGDGPERARLEALVRDLRLESHVVFLGAVSNDAVLPLLAESFAFLMPCVAASNGHTDGIPVAMMEAMACEVPVITRAISGLPELVRDGENGVLVSSERPEDIADATAALLADPDRAARLGRAARAHVLDAFEIRGTAQQLRALIEAAR